MNGREGGREGGGGGKEGGRGRGRERGREGEGGGDMDVLSGPDGGRQTELWIEVIIAVITMPNNEQLRYSSSSVLEAYTVDTFLIERKASNLET